MTRRVPKAPSKTEQEMLSEAVRLHGMGRLDEAAAAYGLVLKDDPLETVALTNLAVIRKGEGKLQDAMSLWRRALEADPADWGLHVSIGRTQVQMGDLRAAIVSCGKALEGNPRSVDALNIRGNALRRLENLPAALLNFDQALIVEPDNALLLENRGALLSQLGRHAAAVEDFSRSLALAPGQPALEAALLAEQLAICDWSAFDHATGRLHQNLPIERRVDHPHNFLMFSRSGADQLALARRYAMARAPGSPPSLWNGEDYDHQRLRIAYVSADFRSHPVAYLIAGLLEHHDRSRFEVHAVALGPRTDDPWRRRIAGAVEHFHDVAALDDRQAAMLLRNAEIDVAVDLNGYTQFCRPAIFAHRPAPIQVNFLGYPGTVGSRHVDYILADRHVIPPTHEAFYDEAVIRLPDSYFANTHGSRAVGPAPTRAACGLPDKGFVFASFNASKKINPATFSIWMRLLGSVAGSVLWLMEGPEGAASNLREEAGVRGVDPARLVFAPRANVDEHLARHQLADLFLDTSPYGAHTTGCDALWAGVPIVTCPGEPFA